MVGLEIFGLIELGDEGRGEVESGEGNEGNEMKMGRMKGSGFCRDSLGKLRTRACVKVKWV